VEQYELLEFAIDTFDKLDVSYALVGSYGSIAFGEYRMTQDIDILIDLPHAKVEAFCSHFQPPDWYISLSAAYESVALRRQFNAIHIPSANKLDLIVPPNSEWGEGILDRRVEVRLLPERAVFIASPEDVILGKLQYFAAGASDKHLRDIAGMFHVSSDQINRDTVSAWAEKLGLAEIWEQILARIDNQTPE